MPMLLSSEGEANLVKEGCNDNKEQFELIERKERQGKGREGEREAGRKEKEEKGRTFSNTDQLPLAID